MRIIAFITEAMVIRRILDQLGDRHRRLARGRHAVRRCGRWPAPCQTRAIRRRNRHRTTSSIGASHGRATDEQTRSSGATRAREAARAAHFRRPGGLRAREDFDFHHG